MALKMCVSGDPGQGKSLFALSMVELGPIAVADTEYRYDWYLDKTEESKTSYKVKKHVCELLGISYPSATVYRIATQDLGEVQGFFASAVNKPEVVGLVHDSASVTWDLLSDVADSKLPGGLRWAGPKKVMRRLQYLILAGQKHYVCVGHLRKVYDGDMKVVGEKPWIEGATSTSMQHWFDVIAKVEKVGIGEVPRLIIDKETTGGVIKRGQVIVNPRFKGLVELIGEGPKLVVDMEKMSAEKVEKDSRDAILETEGSRSVADEK